MTALRWLIALAAVHACASMVNGQWGQDRRLTRNTAGSETSINFARSIAADAAGRVHIAWKDSRDGNSEIYYKRSIDGGSSWGPAIRLSLDPADSNNPSIAALGEYVHVAWWDWASGVPQICYRRSTDGGIRWEDVMQLTSVGVGAHPSLAVHADSVHIAYVDVRHGHSEVYYLRSTDLGDTWEPEVLISALPHNSYTPTVSAWGAGVYVAWTDTRHGGNPNGLEEEYFRRSLDHGASWEVEQRLTEDPAGQPANSWAPTLVSFENSVWIAWFDERDGNWEVYTKHSPDRGLSWTADQRLTFAAGESQRPSMDRRGSSLYIAWWDTRDANNEIYVLHSPNLGETWEPEQRLTEDSGSSILVSLAGAPSGVHIAWQDDRDGNDELYYKRLPGAAAGVENGLIAYVRGVTGSPQIFVSGPQGQDEEQLTVEGSNTYPAWSRDGSRIVFTSNRTGDDQLWIMQPDGAGQTQLTFDAASGNFVPDWSYDGTRIAFASIRDGVPFPEVWTMNLDGSEPTRLTLTPTNTNGPTWSLHPTWAPDDEIIYYASTESGTTQIWGMFANGLGQQQRTDGLGADFPDANVPEFSRCGILTLWAGFELQYGEVWMWDLDDPAGPLQLTQTQDPLSSDNPAWSPDGTTLLFDSNQAGQVNLHRLDVATGVVDIVHAGAFGQSSWQPISPGTPDFNSDGQVDGEDFEAFEACFTGPQGGPLSPACMPGDLDDDGDIDCDDWQLFIAAWTGRPGDLPQFSICAAQVPSTSLGGIIVLAALLLVSGAVVCRSRMQIRS